MYKPHGACGTVTGSAHFVHHVYSDKYIAIDCGLLQGEGDMASNAVSQLPIHPKKLHAIFLTHAHTDHVGNLLQWLWTPYYRGCRRTSYIADVCPVAWCSLRFDSAKHCTRSAAKQVWNLKQKGQWVNRMVVGRIVRFLVMKITNCKSYCVPRSAQ